MKQEQHSILLILMEMVKLISASLSNSCSRTLLKLYPRKKKTSQLFLSTFLTFANFLFYWKYKNNINTPVTVMTIVSRWKEILILWRMWRKRSSPGTLTEMGRYLSLSCRYFSFPNCWEKKITITSVCCQQKRPETQRRGDECYLCNRRCRSEWRNWSRGVQENDAADIFRCCLEVPIRP